MSATGRFNKSHLLALARELACEEGEEKPTGTPLIPGKTIRAVGDFYETPDWAIDAILAKLPLKQESVIVDAGAGTGSISARISCVVPNAEIYGVERRQDLVEKARARAIPNAEFIQGNFLRWTPELAKTDAVIMNPPFSFAMNFVQRAIAITRRGGVVAALLRLNWMAGVSRARFHKENPCDLFVLARRPSFTGRGTDATDYAWFVWGLSKGGRISVLDPPKKHGKQSKKTSKNRKAAKATQASSTGR